MTPEQSFLQGARDSLALGTAAGLFGLMFGVAAVAGGLPGWVAVALSAGVLAGSAQFAALALWSAPLPLGTLALTAALVGARHVLMGITLAPIAAPARRWQRWLGVALMTDFNWALTVTAPPQKRRFAYFVGSGLCLYTLWTGGTAVGVLLPDLLDARTQTATAAAGTLFLGAIATALVKSTGRGAVLPVAAAAAAAWMADAAVGPTAAPAAAVAGGGLIYLGRRLVG